MPLFKRLQSLALYLIPNDWHLVHNVAQDQPHHCIAQGYYDKNEVKVLARILLSLRYEYSDNEKAQVWYQNYEGHFL